MASRSPHSSRSSGRRPPPDYFSRRVQMKLLMLVAMFMLVILLMVEAGKPKNWQWMFAGQQQPAAGESAEKKEPAEMPDPPEPPASPPTSDEQNKPADGAFQSANASKNAPESAEMPAGPMGVDDSDPLTRTQVDGWRRVLEELPRGAEETFRQAMHASRVARRLTAEETAAWATLLPQLETAWDTYHDEALASLAEEAGGLNAQQRDQWLSVLSASRTAWRDRFLPALRSIPLGDEAPAVQQQALDDLQAVLDQVALHQVEDDTVLRLADKDAWFRALDRLRQSAPGALQRASAGPVSYVQLFEQPEVYRGKLVTVRGQARLAYRVPAPENIYGIDHYYIFWLKPAAGPNAPLVVYALQTPPGFPAIADKQEGGETTLNEEVEFTGYFFKRYAYASRGGATTAPLLLARTPTWQPAAEAASNGTEPRGLPTVGFLLLALFVALAVAGCVTALVYLRGRGSSAGNWHKHAERDASDRLRNLARENHPTPIEATLRKLATHDGAPEER